MNTICYRGKIYAFPKNDDSNPDRFYKERIWFIVRNIGKAPFERLESISYIWMNHTFYQLEYDHHIMSELAEYS